MTGERENPPFILLSKLPVEVGRSPRCQIVLPVATVSRRHAALLLRDGRVVVVDRESDFGTYVNSERVLERVIQPGDRVRFGHRIVYEFTSDGFHLRSHQPHEIQLELVGIARRGRLLVDGMTTTLKPGTFVGILGPSGVGKSLLLKTLAGYFSPEKGRILWDGRDVWSQREEYLQHVGFVPQTDILFDALTIEENLAFAARLRLPRFTPEMRSRAVKDVVERLQLGPHARKPVTELSGGQRKRVSAAIELLRGPHVLLLGEPTSGLDPGNEARFLEDLRQVTRRQGTLVVLSTHSPAAFKLFDRLLVLRRQGGVGRLAYDGPPEGLLQEFQGKDAADWFETLETGAATFEPGAVDSGGPPRRTAPEFQDDAPTPQRANSTTDRWPAGRPAVSQLARTQDVPRLSRQLALVVQRCSATISRDRALVAMMILQPLLLGLLVVFSQYNPGKIDPIVFFTVVIAIWLGMNNVVRDLVRERRQYIRDRMSGLRAEAYLAGKTAVFSAIGAVQLVMLLWLVRWGSARILDEHLSQDLVELSPWAWWGGLMLVYLCGMGLGLLVSTMVRTEESAVAALPMLILPQLLLSAVATGDSNVPMSQPRGFRPLIVTLDSLVHPADSASKWEQSLVGRFADAVSCLCYSRPGLLMIIRPEATDFPRYLWIGDLLHVLVLLAATHAAVWLMFFRRENSWPAMAGF